MLYEKVFKALNKAKVRYVVAGGVAVVLHGYQRFTHDLDIIADLEEENLGKLFDALRSVGYMPKVPVTKDQFVDAKQRDRWKKEKGMIVFSFVNNKPPFDLVDLFVNEPIKFDILMKKCETLSAKSICVPIAAIDHLVKLKQEAGRDKDLDDIVQLKAIKIIKRQKNDKETCSKKIRTTRAS